MKSTLYLLIVGVLILVIHDNPSVAQVLTKNTVRADIVREPGVTTEGQMTQDKLQSSISYMDGLGRPVQRISVQASPLKKDIVRHLQYNNLGQMTKEYLPYVAVSNTGSMQSNPLAAQLAFYQASGDGIANDNSPFAVKVYDASSLERVLEEGAQGTDWQPGNNHTVRNQFRLNSTSENIQIWTEAGPTGNIYAEAALSVNELTDENGNKVITYYNNMGQLVLKKVQVSSIIWLETVYVFNDAGNLKYQISPEGVKRINNATASWGTSFINAWASTYIYDSQGRLVEKQAPGAKPVYLVYDKFERLILTQDGELRKTNRWAFIKYDKFQRPVISGFYTDGSARSIIQSGRDNASGPYVEERSSGSTGYTNLAFPVLGIDVFSIKYYDDYDFDNNGSADYSYIVPTLAGATLQNANDNTEAITGVKKRILGTNNWLIDVVFYDSYNRVIQKRSNNQLNANVQDVTSIVYQNSFSSNIIATSQFKQTSSAITVVNKMEYDHNDRLLKIRASTNGGSEQEIASYAYNELGQLMDKKLHKKSNGTYLQSIDFRYTIRGWLSSINNSRLTNDIETNDDSDDVFGMSFSYNNIDAGLSNNQYYNGKISAIKWKTNDQFSLSSNPMFERSYKYSYDGIDRLTAASYAANSGSGWTAEIGAYDELITGYDNNGNMLGLKRYSQVNSSSSRTLIDNLSYNYKDGASNQLSYVSDAASGTEGFKDVVGTADYTYDDNGSLKTDANKSQILSYNEMGKISRIDFPGSKYVTYTYDASGLRLRKTVVDPTVNTLNYDYIDGFVFINTSLSYFNMPEGRVRSNGTYEYFIRDHLGNVRVSFEDNGTGTARIVQENHYYSFGMTMKGVINRTSIPSGANKNLFNGGNELQDDFGGENSYSTFYREYDPVLGRFNGIDPKADSYMSWSPYNFAFNDPIGLNDPMGDAPETDKETTDRKIKETQDWVNQNAATNPGFSADVWAMVEAAWNTAVRSGSDMAFSFNNEGISREAKIFNVTATDEAIYIERGSFYSKMSPSGISGSFSTEVIRKVNTEGDPLITWTRRTDPRSFNITRIGNAYYTTAHYNERYTFVTPSKFQYRSYKIKLNIGIMVNVKATNGQFQKQSLAKESLANAFDFARASMNYELSNASSYPDQNQLKENFIKNLNIGLGIQFSYPTSAKPGSYQGNMPISNLSLRWYPVIY